MPVAVSVLAGVEFRLPDVDLVVFGVDESEAGCRRCG